MCDLCTRIGLVGRDGVSLAAIAVVALHAAQIARWEQMPFPSNSFFYDTRERGPIAVASNGVVTLAHANVDILVYGDPVSDEYRQDIWISKIENQLFDVSLPGEEEKIHEIMDFYREHSRRFGDRIWVLTDDAEVISLTS